jgi:hypothetical protein
MDNEGVQQLAGEPRFIEPHVAVLPVAFRVVGNLPADDLDGNLLLQKIIESEMHLAIRAFTQFLKNLEAVAEVFGIDGHDWHSMAIFVFLIATDGSIKATWIAGNAL